MADRTKEEIQRDKLRVDVHRFWARLAESLKAGNALGQGIVEATGGLESDEFREVAGRIRADLEANIPLYDSLNRFPTLFSKGVVGLIRSGMENNRLPEIAANVAAGLAAVANRAQARQSAQVDQEQEEREIRERFESRRNRIEEWIQSLWDAAARAGASHIHIEPQAGEAVVQFRVVGLMRHWQRIPHDDYESILFAVKKMSNILMLGPIYPQTGHMFARVDGRQIDINVAFSLCHFGENVVIRLFDRGAGAPSFDALGLTPAQAAELERWSRGDAGIVLFCGPTTCGKSTSLLSWFGTLQGRGLKLATVERNLQYLLPEVSHMRAKAEANLDFPEAIRVHMDQNVNALLVDEVRNQDIARGLVDAAGVGILIGTTLQAGGAPEGLYKFCEAGVEAWRAHDLVLGVVAQRLARRICESCRKPAKATDEEKRVLVQMGLDENMKCFLGAGCDQCDGSGVQGGIAFFEVMPMSDAVAAALKQLNGTRPVRAAAVQSGMADLRSVGLVLVESGHIPLSEYLRTTNSVFLN